MATPRDFHGRNSLLKPPSGLEKIVPELPAHIYDQGVITCWTLTEDERVEIARTGVVWLHVAGHNIAPFRVSGTNIMETRDAEGHLVPYDIDAPNPSKAEEKNI